VVVRGKRGAMNPSSRPRLHTRRSRTTCGWLAAALLVAGCTTSGSGDTNQPDSSGDPSSSTSPARPTATPGSGPTAPEPTQTTTPETVAAPQTTAPVAPFEPRTITVVMNGDVLLHDGLWTTAEIDATRTGRGDMDFRPLLADLRSLVSGADLAVCHLETPLAPRGGPYASYPVFSVPPAIVPALRWVGYDACTTASNHSIDQGFDGLTRTLDYLDAAGIEHAGTAATRRASRNPLVMDVNGVGVGIVSATYGTNGIPLPSDQPWSVPLIDIATIKRKAARARIEGADIVMVALHWGLEYLHDPTDEQVAVADQLTRSPDIDFVYGHTRTLCSRTPRSTESGSSTVWATWSPSRSPPSRACTTATPAASPSASGRTAVSGCRSSSTSRP